MTPEKQDELRRIAPTLYAPEPGDPEVKNPFDMFGFECGDGWYEILRWLSVELERELAGLPDEDRGKIRCSQVKEKFGGLRFYMDGPTAKYPAIGDLIRRAEAEAYKTCEECGAPGKPTSKGWIKVDCGGHSRRR